MSHLHVSTILRSSLLYVHTYRPKQKATMLWGANATFTSNLAWQHPHWWFVCCVLHFIHGKQLEAALSATFIHFPVQLGQCPVPCHGLDVHQDSANKTAKNNGLDSGLDSSLTDHGPEPLKSWSNLWRVGPPVPKNMLFYGPIWAPCLDEPASTV